MYIYTGHANGKAREIGGYRKEKQPTYKRWGAYKKRERRKLNTNSSQRTELWKKQPIYRKWGAYKKKEDNGKMTTKSTKNGGKVWNIKRTYANILC